MASTKRLHTISFVVIVLTLVVTVSTLFETITMEIEVTLNGTSIPWNINFANNRSREFKQLALNVKYKLREVLSQQKGVREIEIKEFKEEHGNTSCVFHYKMNSAVVEKEAIEKVLNGTVDIGVIAPVVYAAIKMSLKLSSVSWIDSFDDQNSTDYKNLTRRIKAALSEVYQSTDDVVGFEINSLLKTPDGSVMVEYVVMVYPDSKLKKKDLENTFNEFTKNNSFAGMIADNQPAKQEEEKSESDGAVTGLVVIGALMMCVVIIAFLVRVIKQTWKRKVVVAEDNFESYKETEEQVVNIPRVDSPTSASYVSDNSTGMNVNESKNV